MGKLNHDCLRIVLKEFYDDKKSLYACLLVNRLWCETVVPILWKNPWSFLLKDGRFESFINARIFFNVIFQHLSKESKFMIASQGNDKNQQEPLFKQIFNNLIIKWFNYPMIDVSSKTIDTCQETKPLFNYIRFCEHIRFQIYFNGFYGPEFFFRNYNDRQIELLEREIYKLFISNCSKIKLLDVIGIKHPLHKFPDARISLTKLHEIHCKSEEDPSIFFGLSEICKFIEKFYIHLTTSNPGLAKLIEVQNQVKYMMISSNEIFNSQNKYEKIGPAILKHVHNLESGTYKHHLKIRGEPSSHFNR